MAAFVVSDRRTTGVSLATGDLLWLTAQGSISTRGVDGVSGSGGNALTLDGSIVAVVGFGVLLTGGNNNSVSISNTASVKRGDGARYKRAEHGYERRPSHRPVFGRDLP